MTKQTCVLLLLGPALLGLGVLARPLPAAPETLIVEVRPLDGEIVRGPLESLSDEVVEVGGEKLALDSVRQIRFPDPTGEAPSRPAHLRAHLIGGERILGSFAGSVEDGLVLETPGAGRLELLFDHIATLVAVPVDAGACFEPEARHPRVDGEDIIYVDGEDAFQGLLVSVDADGFELEDQRGRTEKVTWSDFRVLHLANEPPEVVQGMVVETETHDGTKLLTLGAPKLEGGRLRMPLLSAKELVVEVPLAGVLALRFEGGRFIRAATLPFTSSFRTPYGEEDAEGKSAEFLDRWFGARANRRPTGCPLRLHGEVFAHGFAVHAHSTLRLPLSKRFSRFESLFGVDDEALEVKSGGVVDARVLADGKTIWEAKGVKAGERPRRVGPLDVEGVDELVLEVQFGPQLHVRDRATWADPILVHAAR